ncbi:MAG TPA: winged helix-turn-helix domain-containing protein [Pyrinomonadaceae bacterium]|nr:winged helix-turn-helix domain-containing protein [Pyrinomonadaceae bacterium]
MSNANKELYEFENFRLDVSERILWREDEKIPLAEKAFDTLYALVKRGNRLVSKDELLNEIWAGAFVEENNLDKNISILRNVLGERAGKGKYIETVRGHGFRFAAEVRKLSADEAKAEENSTQISTDEHGSSKRSEPPAVAGGLNAADVQLPTDTSEDKLKTKKQIQHFKFFPVALIFVLLISSVAALYFWNNRKSSVSDTKIKTIAVLPFKPLIAENRNESLELGMADTLISKLSGGEITVRPINAVRKFNNLEQDALAAGRELGTETVLDGTIQTAGDRIRISAKLLRTSDGKSLWTGQFDEKFTDIFAVQDSISEKVLAALSLTLNGDKKKQLSKRNTQNIEAYQLYMKGRFHHYKLNYEEAQKGIEYYKQAIAIDPNYALAYAGIADAYRSFSLTSDVDPNDAMPKAKAAALKAIELDETLADAHTALGFILFFYDWDWAAAEKEYKRALELDPNSADAHQAYAHLLSNLGRHSEALAEIKRAKEIEPLNLRTNALEGEFLLHAGQREAAIESLQKAIDLEPNFWMTHLFAASAFVEKGLFDRAFAEGNEAKKFSPSQNWSIAFGAYALAKSGKTPQARTVLDELLKHSKTNYVPPYHFALIYNGLGEKEKALDYLEKGFAEKDVHLVFLKVEPKWNNLQNEPRFIELMKRMKFE